MIAVSSNLDADWATQASLRPNVCPALAAAEDIATLEAALAASTRELHTTPHTSPDLTEIEAASEIFLVATEDARLRLAAADPMSVAGAVAQLLSAIRDIRVGDDEEKLRARLAETKALRFLASVDVLDAALGRSVSQTRFPSPRLCLSNGDEPSEHIAR